MRNIKLIISTVLAVLLTFTGLATAAYDPWIDDPAVLDPALLVYTEGSTSYNPSTTDPDWIAQSWLKYYAFTPGMTFTDYVDVISQSTQKYSENPYFFVWLKDPSLITSINVGKAHLFLWENGVSVDKGENSLAISSNGPFIDSSTQNGAPLDPNPQKHQGQIGYWVRVRIGNVPAVPDKSFGDPDNGDWDPTKLNSYVRVPITYTLTTDASKDVTQLLIHYDAHNKEATGGRDSSTANSHDSSTGYQIPEFPTLALPIAAVIGLVLFFQNRKRKEE